MDYTIQEEAWPALLPEVLPLLVAEHAPETVLHPQLLPYVEVSQYRQWHADGRLCALTARMGQELAGYYLSLETPFVNAPTILTATTTLYFVRPRYRGQGIGRALVMAWEAAMRAKGVPLLLGTNKLAAGNTHPAFWQALGFVPNETVFSKWIGP